MRRIIANEKVCNISSVCSWVLVVNDRLLSICFQAENPFQMFVTVTKKKTKNVHLFIERSFYVIYVIKKLIAVEKSRFRVHVYEYITEKKLYMKHGYRSVDCHTTSVKLKKQQFICEYNKHNDEHKL